MSSFLLIISLLSPPHLLPSPQPSHEFLISPPIALSLLLHPFIHLSFTYPLSSTSRLSTSLPSLAFFPPRPSFQLVSSTYTPVHLTASFHLPSTPNASSTSFVHPSIHPLVHPFSILLIPFFHLPVSFHLFIYPPASHLFSCSTFIFSRSPLLFHSTLSPLHPSLSSTLLHP